MKALIPLTLGLTAIALLNAGDADAREVIVELDAPPVAHWVATQRNRGVAVTDDEVQQRRGELAAAQDQLLQAMSAEGISYALNTFSVPDGEGNTVPVEARYTLVFNGLALDVPDSQIAALRAMPAVRAVHPERMHRTLLNRSVPYIRAPEVYGAIAELTQFDDIREGFEGQGLNISVIDTGVEWSHEMFGGDPTPPRFGLQPATAAVSSNEKVNYYLPLFDAAVDTFGHGTHVASTAGGYLGYAPGADGIPLTADDEASHGVAPQGRIMGYQVCNGVGSASGTAGCLSRAIIMALEDSVSPRTLNGLAKPVAHVINLSLGGSGGPDDSTANAADNAALMGAIVVAAAGNDGPTEATVGSPAAGQHVIAVAASNDDGVFPNSIEVVDTPLEPQIATMAADSNAGLAMTDAIVGRYVFAGYADTPDQVPLTVAGNICLVERGSTATVADQGTGLFANKAANCEAKGAVATVIFNDSPEHFGSILAPAANPVFSTAGVFGQTLLDLGFDATGLSTHRIRLTPPQPALFEPMVTGFSSRGPVRGFGQVKPDVAAPGEAVMAATTPIGVPVLSMQSATRWTAANGTSMASPHVAGAATLVKQAHLDWTPDMVRTALMNTATNPRDGNGVPMADGLGTDNVLAQGAGLIDVAAAVNAKALMGVAGDGVQLPGILGSHSFGEIPVVNSRVSHTETVEVVIRDVSGEGGSYQLAVANNRDLQLDGIDVAVSDNSVDLPPGGQASFTVSATVDGDLIRDTFAAKVIGNTVVFEPIQMQWFLTAQRTDGGQSLRMPFYLRPVGTVPAQVQAVETETFADLMPASDTGLELVEDVTYKDFDVEVTSATFNLLGELSFDDLAGGLPDLDLFLIDPSGATVGSSTTAGGPEHIAYRTRVAGTYTWRVVGWLNAATEFELVSTQELGGAPPVMDPIVAEFTASDGTATDFDGNFTVSWQPRGEPVAFELARSVDGGEFEHIATVKPTVTSLDLVDQPDGELAFRVTAMFPGQIGVFPSAPSAAESVLVSRRELRNITSKVSSTLSNVSFSGGVFAFDLRLTNEGNSDYLPLVEFNIVNIKSSSGTVEVINADNGGSGTSNQDPALFDYSHQLGSDGVFSSAETSDRRHLQFADPMGELFTFRARITGYVGEAPDGDTSASTEPADGGEDGDALSVTQLLEFTVDPLTGLVTTALVDIEI